MDQRSIKPGLTAVTFRERNQPTILGYSASGAPVWSVAGGSDDDSDPTPEPDTDPEDGDDEDDDDEDEDDEPKTKKKRPVKKTTKSKSTEDDDDDEDDDTVPAYKYDRAVSRMKAADKRASEYQSEIAELKKQLKDGKNVPETLKKDLDTLRPRAEKLEATNTRLLQQVAFLTTDVGIAWEDPEAAMRLLDWDEVDIDDGKVDKRALKAVAKQLAKSRPYLVKKPKSKRDEDDDSEDDDEDQRSTGRQSGSTMNGRRKGAKGEASREALRKRFPVLR